MTIRQPAGEREAMQSSAWQTLPKYRSRELPSWEQVRLGLARHAPRVTVCGHM